MGSITETPPLKVAIIGGGPGGLGTAIALSKLPDVTVELFEKATELREIGAGINIGFNCWRVLELLGAADGVKGHLVTSVYHCNGLTGEIVKESGPSSQPLKYQNQRVRRTRLQRSLLNQVPSGIIQLKKKLESLEDLEERGVRLKFEDGTETIADLVVGGDGIRSVVREYTFPTHTIKFTGRIIWRVLLPYSSISHIPEIAPATQWWHGPAGHGYFSLVDSPDEIPLEEQMFELANHNVIDPATATGKQFSWGIPATNERVEKHFTEYDPRLREALSKVEEGTWKEFSSFAGPRLETLTKWGKIVLIGDASHPLTGAFGSGAAFALQDGWIIAQTLQLARSKHYSKSESIAEALNIFDEIRSPYYLKMYEHLDDMKRLMEEAKKAPKASFEDALRARVNSFGGEEKLSWIYGNDIEKVWEEYVSGKGAKLNEQNGH